MSQTIDAPGPWEVARVLARWADTEFIAADAAASLLAAEKAFFQNDLSAICFLASDRAERYKMAKVAIDLTGVSAGRDRAKEWLGNREAAIKAALRVDKLEIP